MAAGMIVDVANDYEEADTNQLTQGKRAYAIAVCIFASLGGLFFGYDQGVTSGVLIMDSFINDYCVGWYNFTYTQCTALSSDLPGEWTTFTAYNLGCLTGAFICGIVADKLERRATIFTASILFCIGTSWVCFNKAQAHTALYVARLVQGFSVGNSPFSLPLFGAEMAPRLLALRLHADDYRNGGVCRQRGERGCRKPCSWLAHDQQSGHGAADRHHARYLVRARESSLDVHAQGPRGSRGRAHAPAPDRQRARRSRARSHRAAGGARAARSQGPDGADRAVDPQARLHRHGSSSSPAGDGHHAIMSYGALIFKDITHAGIYSSLFITGIKFVATIPAMRWINTCGCRYLLLIGAAGMIGGHLLAAILFTALCDGKVKDAGCPKVGGWFICIGTALFSVFYGISWGPVCWIYPAEIFPMSVRASAVSLSTASNWAMAALMAQVVKQFPYLNINGVFFLFAGFCCICFLFVYFFCPETMGVILEDVELLFDGSRKSAKSAYGEMKSPVNVA